MPIYYDSKEIRPVPFPNIRKSYTKTQDGKTIGSFFDITMTGKLVAFKGSPNSSGIFNTGGPDFSEEIASVSRQKAIETKQEALRNLFSNEGRSLEIQPWDGAAPMKCNPRNIDIQFSDGIWFDTCDYTITFQADVLYKGSQLIEDNFTDKVEDASESWDVEASDQPNTYRLTHNCSAKGKRFYNADNTLSMESWQQARNFVLNTIQLGYDPTKIQGSGVYLDPNYTGYNHARTENIDEVGGSYSVVETWLVASGIAVEEFTISSRNSIDETLNSVTIEGTVTGLYTGLHNFDQKYTNANTYFTNTVYPNLVARAQSYSGYTDLNSIPQNTSVGRNPKNGIITYSYEYNNRLSNCINGAISETISVNFVNPADVFAMIPVLGRSNGPVLQATGARTERRKGLSIEVVFPASGCTSDPPNLDTFVCDFKPTGRQVFVSRDEITQWIPKAGRFSRSVEWVYEV